MSNEKRKPPMYLCSDCPTRFLCIRQWKCQRPPDDILAGASLPDVEKLAREIDGADLIEWLHERYDNCLRIAAQKTGDDKDGWLEDAEYFAGVLKLLRRSLQPPLPQAPAKGEPPQLLEWHKKANTAINTAFFHVEHNENGKALQTLADFIGEIRDAIYPPTLSPQQGQGWVRVEDRAAPGKGDFLAYDANQNWTGVAWKDVHGFFLYTGGIRLRRFTHWQPLPAPPAAAEQEKK